MNDTASGRYTPFDPHSARFFDPIDSDEEALSANPLEDLPNPGDEIQEIPNPTDSSSPSLQASEPPRVTRSTILARDTTTAHPQRHRPLEVEGGLKRGRVSNAASDAKNMPSRPKRFVHGGVKPLNTLDRPTGSKSHFVAANTTRSVYDPPNSAKRVLPAISPPPTNPSNPPFKKLRIGKSPMQGRSKSDAISVDDSQGLENGEVEAVQFTPEPNPGTAQNRPDPQQRSTNQGAASSTRSSSRQQALDSILNFRTDKDGPVMLPTSPRPKPSPHLNKKHSFVDLDGSANDSGEEQEAVDFTKNAAERRRAGKDSSSPDRGASRARTRIESPYFTPADRGPATARRKAPSPKKHAEPIEGSQSPDVLQAGITTQDAGRPGRQQLAPQPKGMSARSASSIAKGLIVGNPDSTKVRTMKPRRQAPPSDIVRFEFADVNCSLFELPKLLENVCFFVDLRRRDFFFDYKDPMIEYPEASSRYESLTTPCPVGKIMKATYAPDSSKLILKLSHMEGRTNGPVALDLLSHKKVVEVIQTLSELNGPMTVNTVDGVRLDKMFEHAGNTVAEQARYRHRNPQTNNPQPKEGAFVALANQERNKQRPRIADRLDNAPDQSRTIITGRDREMASRGKSDEISESRLAARTAALQNGDRSKLTSQYFREPASRAQSLRSSTATEKRKLRSPSPPRVKFSETGGLGDPWAQPLTYPKDGQKRETVGYGDLWRLDDDEFLNDTLIGFFLRYLQHRTEVERPEVLKKMHFFNSYFFDTLNKGTKSVKSINYEAVVRWTRNVNLFTRDFVIVPVNENLHWFVAIICNLSYFERQRDEEEQLDDAEEGAPPAVTIEDEEEAAGDQGQRTKETQESFEDLTIEDEDSRTSPMIPSSQTKAATPRAGRGRKKKIRRSLPKYDTEKPVIITFDSLGIARSGICSSLKQYVVQEAKNKKDLNISDQEIKGMTAKNIPTQSNYSDCGLYMCMYLEQFMCDPHCFVQKLLQRDEAQIRWPNKIHSDELRTRMRNLILDLHRGQEGEQVKAKEAELGKILVDMRGPSPEPEPPVLVDQSPPPPSLPSRPATSEEFRARKQRFSNHFDRRAPVEVEDEDGFEPEADERPMSSSSQRRRAEEALALVDRPTSPNERNTVVIDDDGSPVRKKKRLSSPSEWEHREPRELAAHLKMARSSPSHPKVKRSSPTKAERGQRSHSVTTDFLQGMASFASGDNDDFEEARYEKRRQKSSPNNPPQKEPELSEEVPETQEERDTDENDNLSVEELKPVIKEGEGRAGDEELLV